MNLDLEDPLGDLLSDGSNDSLFGIEITKKPSVVKTDKKDEPKKNKMEQLFGIAEGKDMIKLKTDTNLSPSKSIPNQQKLQNLRSSQQQIHDNLETKSNDSISSDLGFDPKKPKKKKNSILDDLLGINEMASVKMQLPSKPQKPTSISRQTTSETISEQNMIAENQSTNVRKSGRRQSAVIFNDPLGLFAQPSEKEKEQIKKSTSKIGRKSIAGSEWLFNSDGNSAHEKTLIKLKSSPAIQITQNSEDHHEEEPSSNITSLESKNTLTNLPSQRAQLIVKNTHSSPHLMESLVSETANTINNLKQQEFQLMVASQMKTQENVLIEMKNKQQELLKQQEQQFNELLRKQIARQNELEEIIKNQQERINSHIQSLYYSNTQAPFFDIVNTAGTMSGNDHNNNTLEKIELEGDVKRLEMEKLRLEDLLSNINDNHEKEIIMIEQSYKKRIQLMEENLESMERRYREEIMSLEKFHSDKIKSISEERENVISNFELKIKIMEESHQNFTDKLKQSYESDLEMLKRHYEEMMQNIRKSKFMEFAIKEESSVFADMIKKASSNLENATGDITQLHEVLQEKLSVLERDREIQLNSREKRLEEKQKLLERTKEISEAERQKLLDLVQTLDLKLNSIEQKSDEEQWSLKQKHIAFEAERQSFEKEKEFLRNQIAREQQKLQEFKQSQLNEHAKLLNEIEDERQKLHEDRARNEIAKTLHLKNADDTGRSRVEIDAAVKYAEEVAKQLEKERERMIEMQHQLDMKRHEMMDRENVLRMKQSELENLIIRTKQKEEQAENFLNHTKKTERMLMLKYQSLQKYTIEVSERETKITKERLDINAEKMKLKALRKKIFESRCSLCKIDKNELSEIMQNHTQQIDNNIDDDFDDINNITNEKADFENFDAIFKRDMKLKADINEDWKNMSNKVDINDELFDSDLLMLKFDVLNSMS